MATGRTRDLRNGPTRAVDLTCDHCGGHYRRRLDRVRPEGPNHCSRACSTAAHREEHLCDVCGGPYVRPSCRVPKSGGSFCSHRCAIEAQRCRITLECPICHEEFQRIPSLVRPGSNYCSKACADIGRRTLVSLRCEECDREFTTRAGRAEKRRFCSRECFVVHGRRRMEATSERARTELYGEPTGEAEV